MPELPEVEVTRRSLSLQLPGASIISVQLGKPLRWPLGCAPEALVGLRVASIDRRGKYLLLRLDSARSVGSGGDEAGYLMVHLGMSGSLLLDAVPPTPEAHDHFVMQTSHGALRLRDPRRFGAVMFVDGLTSPWATKLLGRLGAEPLSDAFEVGPFVAAVRRSRLAIKQLLLGGQVVVGVGNIYASEVLFQSGIHPARPAKELTDASLTRLYAAIREVLARAVGRGGTTLRDFASADGQMGHFQSDVTVYGREGMPCVACGHTIRKIVQGQRSTYFCAVCQPI